MLEKAITQVKDAEEQAERILTEAREQAACCSSESAGGRRSSEGSTGKRGTAEAEKKLRKLRFRERSSRRKACGRSKMKRKLWNVRQRQRKRK